MIARVSMSLQDLEMMILINVIARVSMALQDLEMMMLIILIARVSLELQRGTGSFCSLYGSSVTRENQYSATLVIVLLMMITMMIIITKRTSVMMITRMGVKPLAGRCFGVLVFW